MPSRTLPGLGLNGFWSLGENGWNTGHDANLRELSALCQLNVLSRTTNLPGSPTQGQIYINPESAPSFGGQVAVRDDGAWRYFAPQEGWRAWVEDEDALVVFDGSGWRPLQSFNPVCMAQCNYDAFIGTTWTKVPLNEAPVDPRTEFNTTTNTYTVAVPGVYEIALRGEFKKNSTAATAMNLRARKDGSSTVAGSLVTGSVGGSTGGADLGLVQSSCFVSLVAGDNITMECQMATNDGYLTANRSVMLLKLVG